MNALMRHEDAIKSHAVERYLLDEMSVDEQEIFEEHYFDCSACSADVTDGTRMMMAGKAVVEEEREAANRAAKERTAQNAVPSNVRAMPRRFWTLPAATAASLILPLLGGGIGYRVATQQRHEPTELVRVVHLDTGISRAGTPAEVPEVRPGDGLRFDVPSADAVAYDAVVRCGGKTESTHGISWEMAADAVTLRIGELPAGRCDVVIQGVRKDGKRFGIISKPFQVGER